MKKAALLRLTLINLLVVALIILPFLPGPFNKLVVVLSVFTQSAGFFGLPLVLIGFAWIIVEIRKKHNNRNKQLYNKLPYYFTVITAVIITLISLLLLVGVCANFGQLNTGLLVGFAGVAMCVFALIRVMKAIKKLKINESTQFNPLPLYLVTIPLVAFCARALLMEPMSSYSRNIAIEKADRLINAIEAYKNIKGIYPKSLLELDAVSSEKMEASSVMGISDFRYNQVGDRYSVSFSQWLELGSLEEIVLYDKDNLRSNLTDEFAKYDYAFDLCRIKGAFISYDTQYTNWRYYLVD
jgi:hypothetical protein